MTVYCMHCMLPTDGAAICPHCGYEGEATEMLHQLRSGSILNNRYLVGTVLGQGGFGITYIGRDLTLNKRVAIKEYYPAGSASRNVEFSPEITITDKQQAEFIEDGKRKFLNEARALAQFEDHPGIVTVRDYFEANHTAYIVMEYLEGQDLRAYLKGARFQADDIFNRMRPVMDALEKIHEVGIIHRDISPDNIMLLTNGTVKLMDFGAARQLDLSGNASISVVLKTGYAPEEQYRTRGQQGPWTDIYALCATIYRCITGLKPDDSLERACQDELAWPSELGVHITALQEAVLKKGMAVRAEDRFQNIREMKEMLFPAEGGNHALELDEDDDVTRRIPRSHEDAPPHDTAPLERKHRKKWLWSLVAVVAVLLVAVGIWVAQMDWEGTGRNGGVSQADIESGMYMRVVLTASEELPVRDFAPAAQLMEERVDLLCDGKPYDFALENDQIKLFLPRSVIEPLGLEKTMQCYISRRMEFSLINIQKYQADRTDYIAVSPSDVESITIETEAPADLSAPDLVEALEKGGLEKLVFTEEFIKKNGDKISQWGTDMVLAQDIEGASNFWYSLLHPAGDGKTFYITNTDGAEFARLHQYNLMHEPLPKAFYFAADMNYEAVWETEETADVMGEFQRSFDEVTGETITVCYPWVDSEELPEDGRFADACAAMKRRLDLLGQAYAFGTIRSDDTDTMVIKTSGVHMSIPLMHLLEYRHNAIRLTAGLNQLYASRLNWVNQPDGTYALEIDFSGREDELADVLQLALEQGEKTAYLTVDDIPWLACDLEDAMEGGSIVTFDRGCFWDNQPIQEENSWLVKLLTAISQDTNLPTGASAAQYQCNEDEHGRTFDDTSFSMQYDDLTEQVRERILNADIAADYEQMEVISDGVNIRVFLHMNTGKNFASQVVEVTKALYELADIERSPAAGLYLYFIDENDMLKERSRIWFYKSYGTGSRVPGHLGGSGAFAGGRMEEYTEELQALIEEDPFFVEKKMSEEDNFCEYTVWW